MKSVTNAIIKQIEFIGYDVHVAKDQSSKLSIEAINDDEYFQVIGDDLYKCAVELAQQIGMELEE